MSYEAWGDDDAGDYDHLLEAGWWDNDQAKMVVAAIKALRDEQVYEDGEMTKGISTAFLARITMIEVAAGLRASDDLMALEAVEFIKATENQKDGQDTFADDSGRDRGEE